eukprot:3451417-Rhodomonas_salina.2
MSSESNPQIRMYPGTPVPWPQWQRPGRVLRRTEDSESLPRVLYQFAGTRPGGRNSYPGHKVRGLRSGTNASIVTELENGTSSLQSKVEGFASFEDDQPG